MAGPFKSNPRPSHGAGGDRGAPHTPSLPTPKEIEYFEDPERQKLNPQLVDGEAARWAGLFKTMKTTQMRRFYDELKAIERKILTGNDAQEQQANFERDRAFIMMFKAKAVYAEKRKVSPREFTQFIFDHTASIKKLEDFQAFLKIFEAVVAFHRFFSEDK